MRIRVLGQYVHLSIVARAAVETMILFSVLMTAVQMRFRFHVEEVEQYVGPLWPRAVVFSGAMSGSLLAFGLYSARQRARSAGILVRVAAAVAAGVVVTAV